MSPDCVTFTVLLSQTEQLVAAQSITGFRAFAAKVEAKASAIKDPTIKKGMTSLALYYNQLAASKQQPKSAGQPGKSLTADVDSAANACDRYYSARSGSAGAAPAA